MYIIAEAAQGFEGSLDTCKLLVRAAAAGGADAIKFQLVFADDLAEPGYTYYELFQSLEMPLQSWKVVAEECGKRELDLVFDVFGPQGLSFARDVGPAGIKLHSTSFFDVETTMQAASLAHHLDARLYISIGGIPMDDVRSLINGIAPTVRNRLAILYGYQSEPTPIESNNLARIPRLREELGIEIGFMDHSDGSGPDWLSLSACALGFGTRLFEKHITLERALKMEDYVSALAPSQFREYTLGLRRLESALGSPELALTPEEVSYGLKAVKKILVKNDMRAGDLVNEADIRFSRPAEQAPAAYYTLGQVVGRPLSRDVFKGDPLTPQHFGDK